MSYMSRLAWVFLGLWILGLAPAYGQEEKPPEKPWTGKLADGRVITKTDLDQILQGHKLWLESKGEKGEIVNLFEADLSGADLSGADLSGAYLIRVVLDGAKLTGADLSGANLSEVQLSKANLIGAALVGALLREAYLGEAKLNKAHLVMAKLTGAGLPRADLSGADLREADLSGADLSEVDLSGANLTGANLSGARFEPNPGSLPGLNGLLYLKGLDSLRFEGTSSYGPMELREIFKKAGMRDQERQLNYALNHNRRINAWKEIKEEKKIGWVTREIARLGNNFQLVFFEWTCDYGMTPSRPLLIMFAGLFLFTLPYLLALRSRDPRSGIWLLLLPDRVLDRQIKDRPVKLTFRTPLRPMPAKMWARFLMRCQKVWRGLRLAFYFSLLSAFNLGWRELNVGTWITRIQKREYTLRGTGWVRMISGIQALLSVYLLALWALTYFGRPFE